MPRKYPAIRPTPQTKDLPATQGMLYLVRTELKADINGLRSDLKGEIAQLRYRMEAGFEKFNSEINRLAVLIEEQNARNVVVLEGLTGLFQREERIEKRMDECEQTIRSIARIRSAKSGSENRS